MKYGVTTKSINTSLPAKFERNRSNLIFDLELDLRVSSEVIDIFKVTYDPEVVPHQELQYEPNLKSLPLLLRKIFPILSNRPEVWNLTFHNSGTPKPIPMKFGVVTKSVKGFHSAKYETNWSNLIFDLELTFGKLKGHWPFQGHSWPRSCAPPRATIWP